MLAVMVLSSESWPTCDSLSWGLLSQASWVFPHLNPFWWDLSLICQILRSMWRRVGFRILRNVNFSVLDMMKTCSEAEPFLHPVDLTEAPDYYDKITVRIPSKSSQGFVFNYVFPLSASDGLWNNGEQTVGKGIQKQIRVYWWCQ